MGKASGRSQWILVLLLLGGALTMTSALFFPGFFGSRGRGRMDEIAGSLSAESSQPETVATDGARPRAAELPPGQADELPSYGDKNLPRDESIRGRITSADEKPVADAVVVAVYYEYRTRPYRIVTASRVRSEEDGTFVLGPLPRHQYTVLAVKKEVGVAYMANQMPGAWVELILAAGARVAGTVTARATSEPVAGARVVVKDGANYLETTTDAEGKYALAQVPASANSWAGHQVIVVADGFQRAQRTNLLLRDDRDHGLDFALVEGKTLKGKVVDAQSLQPVAGAVVGEGWEPFHRTTRTEPDGTFSLAHVDPSPNLIFTARAERYQPQQRQSDGTGRMEFELDASLVVAGVVKDHQDAPVAGARVYLHRVKHAPGFTPVNNNQQKNFTTSDAAGKFRFDDVLPGQVAVIAFHADHAPGEKDAVEIPVGGPAPQQVQVLLRQGLTVEGEVRDIQDAPLASVRVQLQRSGWGQVKGYKYAHNYRWNENPIFYTDEKGAFELRGAMAGKHWLSAWDATLGWSGIQIEGVEGQRVTGVIISFAGASITGTFKNAAGDPVPGAWIYARGPKNTPRTSQRWTQADSLGRFKLGGLKEGSYDLNASSSLGRPETLKDIPAGSQGVELVLKVTQVLSGEVTSIRTGRPLERFFIQLQPQRASRRSGNRGTNWAGWIESPDGRFERPVAAAKYNVTIKAPGHAPRVIKDMIVEELVAPTPLFVTLDAGGGIQGTILDNEGRPVRNGWLNARVYRAPGEQQQPTDWALGGNDRTDSRGRFFIMGLASGTYLLQLNLGTRGAATAQVAVAGSEMVTHNLALLPTGTVQVKVVDEEGKPVQGVMFYFRDENNNWLGYARQSSQAGIAMSGPIRMGAAVVQTYHRKREYEADPFDVVIESNKMVVVEVTVRKKKKEDG